MASVFISYSRKDQDFVRKLFDALKAAGRDAWVDWEGIPPTAEWLKEVYTAIDGADTFVFVLSPDSVASEVCGKEVAHAVESRKRIIPLVCRQVGTAEVKAVESLAPLAALNWIFMRESDDFGTAFEQLRFALDTDLDYWHLSSDLLVRAKKWQDGSKNANLTLRGPELASAERWLTAGADKEPRPSAMQLDFITASRKDANARQRRLLTGVSTALVVTLILAVISASLFAITRSQNGTIQSQNSQLSQKNTQLNQVNNDLSNANKTLTAQVLAGRANGALLATNLDQALLLGAEASTRLDSYETRNVLFSAIEASPYLDASLVGSQAESIPRGGLAFSGDGKTLLTSVPGLSFSFTLWDLSTKQPRAQSVTQPNGGCTGFQEATLSPDAKTIAAAAQPSNSGPTVCLLSDSGTVLRSYPIPAFAGGFGSGVSFSPDGQLLAIPACPAPQNQQCLTPYVDLVSVSTGALVHRLPLETGSSLNLGVLSAFTPDGRSLAVSRCTNRCNIIFWDVGSGVQVSTRPLPSVCEVHSLAINRSGTELAAGGFGCSAPGAATVLSLDGQGPDGLTVVQTDANGLVGGLCLTGDGRTLVTGDANHLRLWSLQNGQEEDTSLTGHLDGVGRIVCSPDGFHFASLGGDGRVLLWRTTPGSALSLPGEGGVGGVNRPFVFSPDSKQLITADDNNNVRVWNISSGQVVDTLPNTLTMSSFHTPNNRIFQLAVSPDGTLLAVGAFAGQVQLINLKTHTLAGDVLTLPNVQSTYGGILAIAFSRDGRLIQAADAFSMATWDVATHAVKSSGNAPGVVGSLAFAPDDTPLVNDTANLTDKVYSAAVSADGKLMATAGNGSNGGFTVTVKSADGKTTLDTFPMFLNPRGILQLTLGYDGSTIVASDGAVLTWRNVQKHESFVRSITTSSAAWVYEAALSPDGTLLATSTWTYAPLIVRYATLAGWIAQACQIADRNLTQAEWKSLASATEQYHKTCPNLPAGT
jgi:WD40 repeat protein